MSDAPLRHSSEVAWVDSGERVVVVRLDDLAADPVALEGSGAAIWLALSRPATVSEVVSDVAAYFDVERAAIAGDVAGFVADLTARGLLTTG